VQNANDQVELARNSQIQGEIRDQETDEFGRRSHILRGYDKVVIDETVQDELKSSAQYPFHTNLVNPETIFVVVLLAKRTVVHDREERKNYIRE
jgi:hypothetical protein